MLGATEAPAILTAMTPEAIALFRELADYSPAEREAYYVRQRVSDALRGEVESLLRFDGDSIGAIHGRVAAAARKALASPAPGETETREGPDSDSRASGNDGRFAPGALLTDRYRIISLVGRGGMGEVYRATDLKLKQPVALKFLPEAASRDPRLVARFHGEVRLARQISHPNVCRVYDIGDVNGLAFISMEYIDGEDLASLLRRIGRLPGDKAIEIARRLCAGLAAAHDKGVVHRDLKPGNVMIDSRGQVFITDFGLAVTARELEHTQLRSGTPAYMAPEQLEGREVTVQSDLYALGLVLYEMFTGKRPFIHGRTPGDRPPRIDSVIKDIDAAVARTIQRCLESVPRDRPSSALEIAASLPGGNPLAEALAAGVTPSPEMVAAARSNEAVTVRAAVLALTLVLVGLAAAVVLSRRVSLLRVTPFPYPPQVLEQKAREIIASLGHPTSPLDRDSSFFWNGFYQLDTERNVPVAEYRAQLAMGQPSLVSFRYRQSSQYLLFFDPAGDYIDEGDPPLRVPGDVYVSLDLHGRLRHIEAVPTVDSYERRSAEPVEWSRLFALAGLDPARFVAAAPRWIPPVTFDARAAWTGRLAHSPSVSMRVEAAAWRGVPVYFRLTDDAQWAGVLQAWYGPFAGFGLVTLVAPWLVGAGGILVAWRNHHAGRTDLRGASRLGVAIFSCCLISRVFSAHHVPTSEYLPAVFRSLATALTIGVLSAVLYMAVEPFIRRRWPESLISWTRLLSGRIRDSLVGGHIAVGTAFGIGLALWSMVKMAMLLNQGLVTPQDWRMLGGPEWVINRFVGTLVWWAVVKTLSVCVLLLFAKLLLRRDWIAFVAVVLLTNVVTIVDGPRPLIQTAFEVPAAAVAVWLLVRWGVLPMMVAFFVSEVTVSTPLTTDFAAWYSGPTIVLLGTVCVLAISGFSAAMAGRPLFHDELLERTS